MDDRIRLRIAAWLSRGYHDRAWVVVRHTADINARLVDALREVAERPAPGYYRHGKVFEHFSYAERQWLWDEIERLRTVAADALRRESYVGDRGARG